MPRTAVDIDFKRSLAATIRQRMKEDNLSISTLAERMGTARTAVRRILDARNTSITFRSMSRAAQAVGLKIKFVSEPMPMKTKTNSVIYYLYFASQKPVAASIVDDIFEKYRKRQGL